MSFVSPSVRAPRACLWALFLLASLSGCATAGLQDTSLKAAPWDLAPSSDTVRVRIAHSRHAVRIGCTGEWAYRSAPGGRIRTTKRALSAKPARRGVFIGNHTVPGTVWVQPVAKEDFISVNGRSYRGVLILQTVSGGNLDVVEQLNLEEYLYGVLPKEVGINWPMEALKAQAVISRTFALANKSSDPNQRFDLVNDVRSQVYGGRSVESVGTNRAVLETLGEVLVDSTSKPIQAYFHSSCGGMTEKPRYVWTASQDPDVFAQVEDPYCQEDPYRNWEYPISFGALRTRLRKAHLRVGSSLKGVEVAATSPSGRASAFRVLWKGGHLDIPGNRFRLALGPEALRSTLIADIKTTKHGVVFTGHGWGHGIGLCQYGARGRAAAGQSYESILKTYYPGATLEKPYYRK